MTIRAQLKLRYRLMLVITFTIPPLSIVWLESSTPLNHTFRINVIVLVLIANALVFLARFKCPNCRTSLSTIMQRVLTKSEPCTCPHCGINIDA